MNWSISSKLYLIITVAIAIAIVAGYKYSHSMHNRIAEIWKETLWEDCHNRMSEINARKIYVSVPATNPSDEITIKTEGQTVHIKKDSAQSGKDLEKEFLANQYYLSTRNPMNVQKLNSLFQSKLKENGFNFETVVSVCNQETSQQEFSGQKDAKALHDYMKFTYKVDVQDMMLLDGYAKGGWLERIVQEKGYYIILTLTFFITSVLFVLGRRKSKTLKPSAPDNQAIRETPLVLPVEYVQPDAGTIFLNEKKHALIYREKEIPLAPKLFSLFYLLVQGENYFQSYEYLLQNLWTDKEGADKKHLEQLVIRLRKELKGIPLGIEAIRGNGYQIKGENKIELILNE